MSDQNQNHTYSDWKNRLADHSRPSTPETVTAATVDPAEASEATVTDRQERITGFDQETLSTATALLVGAGTVGGEIAEGLTWKGIGTLQICDSDSVAVSNLSRQPFREQDVGENKALALARNLAPDGTRGTELVGYPHHFEDALALGYEFAPDIVVCAPDNDMARLAVAASFYGEAPVVVTGLDPDANGGYVFLQERTGPCFQCYRPDANGGGACPGAPSVTDPGRVIAGIALYAVDAALMARPQTWNLFELWLSGEIPPTVQTVDQQAGCPLCGGVGG